MQGQGKAPGVTRNTIEIKGQLGEESRLGLRHAMGSGMPVLLWMYKSRGDTAPERGSFDPGVHLTFQDVGPRNPRRSR